MSADPTTGSPAGIRSLATAVQQDAADIRSASATTTSKAGSISDADWSGSAKGSFVSTAGDVAASAERTAAHVDATVTALLTYATRVEQIQRDADVIKAQQQHNADELALTTKRADKLAGSDDDVDAVQLGAIAGQQAALRVTGAALDRAWQDLVTRRKAADAEAVSKLGATDVVGVVPPSNAVIKAMSGPELLAFLKGLQPEELAALAGNRAIADGLAGLDDPKAVAKWWNGLGDGHGKGSYDEHSAAQDALLAAFPVAMGNLNGVAYWARDTANRTALASELSSAKDRAERLRAQRNGPSWSPALEQDLADAEKRLQQLTNLSSAAEHGTNLPGYRTQLVAFRPGHPPLGAVSVGDLDTAKNTTFVVPGMSTTLGDTTVVLRAARNLVAEQRGLGADDTAAVAWINYDAPVNFPDNPNEVLRDDKARVGGHQLALDLAGYRATVGQDTVLNVAAHSYGTTTAAIGLQEGGKDLGVNSMVNLGSAGMPWTVPNAAATHADHVYAGTGDESIAVLGRVGSARFDPEFPLFGAEHLETGPETGPGGPLAGVTAHDPVLHKHEGESGPKGYFDLGTSSLYNTAKATLER